MKRLTLVASALLALVAASSASAQELNLATTSADHPGIVTVRGGVDHALLGEVGYRRVLILGERQLFVGGDIGMPWAKPDLADYRVRATVGLPLGADLRLAGGYYAPRWFVAGETGADWVAATRITFSERYRTVVYSGAKNGWYRTPGGTTYVGLHAGLSFSSFDLIVRAGHPRTTALAEQTLPFYFTLGVNVALPR
jgi:hypothetical protein